MIQIALFAIAGMMLVVFVGNMCREIGIWIALVTGVIVFFYAIRKFEYMVDMVPYDDGIYRDQRRIYCGCPENDRHRVHFRIYGDTLQGCRAACDCLPG